VPEGDATANLIPLGDAGKAVHLELTAPQGSPSAAHATVSVNTVGPLDLLQAAVTGLKPSEQYTLWLVTARTAPLRQKEPLATFKTNLAGAQVVQTIGPLRQILSGTNEAAAEQAQGRFLMITGAGSDAAELVQK